MGEKWNELPMSIGSTLLLLILFSHENRSRPNRLVRTKRDQGKEGKTRRHPRKGGKLPWFEHDLDEEIRLFAPCDAVAYNGISSVEYCKEKV